MTRTLWLAQQSGNQSQDFERIIQVLIDLHIKDKRNLLAHGGAIPKEIAASLREAIIGDRSKQGMLCWLTEHMDAG